MSYWNQLFHSFFSDQPDLSQKMRDQNYQSYMDDEIRNNPNFLVDQKKYAQHLTAILDKANDLYFKAIENNTEMSSTDSPSLMLWAIRTASEDLKGIKK